LEKKKKMGMKEFGNFSEEEEMGRYKIWKIW
jgi:hypothetical protein